MTAVTDAITILDKVRGKASTNAELLRIADHFIAEAGSAFQPAIPGSPTNEEKAQLFLSQVRILIKSVIVRQQRAKSQTTAQSTIDSDVTTAMLDINT